MPTSVNRAQAEDEWPDRHVQRLPAWLPLDAVYYLAHTEQGLPIRTLARYAGCHASTVLRKIRRVENQRDDHLVDKALRDLGSVHFSPCVEESQSSRLSPKSEQRNGAMLSEKIPPIACDDQLNEPAEGTIRELDLAISPETLRYEGLRILRHLLDPAAVLAVAIDMDKAVVVKETLNGKTSRDAVIDNTVAQAMALKNWIACDLPGRVSRYRITTKGRAALTAFMAEAENRARKSVSEGRARNEPQSAVSDPETINDFTPARRRIRYCTNETPLQALARRRDKAGHPFLSDELVRAGERLREDFELSQMGPAMNGTWDNFLAGDRPSQTEKDQSLRGPAAARARIAAALEDLGPGLGDMALRCCCYLEGLETAEQRMGWSARSGKIVLRIALQRLRRHYETLGQSGGMVW